MPSWCITQTTLPPEKSQSLQPFQKSSLRNNADQLVKPHGFINTAFLLLKINMVDIVTIEYCRGCHVRHSELAHPQTRYQELYRQVEQLLKQEGYRVFADRWPRTGSFEVSLNRKVVFSKLEGQVLPEPGQIVTIVLEAKRKTNLRMKALHKEQKVRDHNRSYWSPFINENYPHQRDYREVRASSVRKLWSTQ